MSESEHNDSAEGPSAIPFPTLTIFYLPQESLPLAEEIGEKYTNVTIEECTGYFHGAGKKYHKVTVWSQGIDSLWINAIIARVKELSGYNSIALVSGGILYLI